MLTSFFDKSSPFNYLLLSIYLVAVLFLQATTARTVGWEVTSLLVVLMEGTLLIFSMLLVDFFIRKNALTASNTLGIFSFSTSALLVPLAFHSEVLWGLFFVLLGLRRMFSLQSGRNDVRKITDASFWFFVATYFYFWNVLWFIPLYIAITSMKELRFRYYFIPPITGVGLLLIFSAYFLMKQDSFHWLTTWAQKPSLLFREYGNVTHLIAITVLFAFLIWSFFFRIILMPEIPKKYKSNFVLGFFVAVVGILVATVAPNKTGAELVYIAPGFALILATYLERNSDLWLRELMMWVLLILPIVLPFL